MALFLSRPYETNGFCTKENKLRENQTKVIEAIKRPATSGVLFFTASVHSGRFTHESIPLD